MRLTTLIALSISALLLGGYVLFVERHGPDTDQLLELERRILPGLRQDQVRQVWLRRPGQPEVELKRDGDTWRTVRPTTARADREVMARILSGLEFLEQIRSLPPESDRRQLGLAPPEVSVELAPGPTGRPVRIELGRPDPSGRGVYLALGNALYVVGRELLDAVELEPEDLRDRQLVVPGELRRIRIAGVVLLADSAGWSVETPRGRVRAAPAVATRLVAALRGLRARRFLPQRRGSPPGVTLQIEAEGPPTSLWVGGPCPGRPQERVGAWKEGSWLWCCIDREDVAPLEGVTLRALLDPSLTDVREPDLVGIRIRRGARQLALRRDGRWRMSPGEVAADNEEVTGWVARLAAAAGEPELVEPGRLGQLVSRSAVEIELVLRLENGGEEQLRVGRPRGGRAPLQRADEPMVLWVPQQLLELFDPDPLRFRSRQVLALASDQVTAIKTVRGGETEVVVREGRRWQVARPVRVPADQQGIGRLLGVLSRLRAKGFVTGTPAGDSVSLVISRGTGPELSLAFRLADEGGDCHGRLPGAGPWFVLDEAHCALLTERRAVRAPLVLQESSLRRIEVSTAQGRFAGEKRGPAWVGRDGTPLDSARVAELIQALRRLSGPVAGYGPGAPSRREGVELRVTDTEGRSQACTIDRQGRARTDKGVVYTLDPAQVRRLEQVVSSAGQQR